MMSRSDPSELERRRVEAHLNTRMFSTQTGIARGQLYRYELGDCLPSLPNALMLAAHLGCRVEDLWTSRGPR
jgi:DNA-binding XRE family transcriptional regulator